MVHSVIDLPLVSMAKIKTNQQFAQTNKLEDVITKRLTDVETTLASKIHENTEKILSRAAENVKLKKENTELRDQLSCIETQQLRNNVIINGVAETKWQPYEVTKTRVYETIASALPIGDHKLAMDEAL